MKKTTQQTTYRSPNPREAYKSFELKNEIDYDTYRRVVVAHNILLMKSIMEEGAVYKLPWGLGKIGCFQRSTYGKGVLDYKLYNETGIYRYIKNIHSDGRVVRFVWDPVGYSGIPRELRGFYEWRAPRDHKRALARMLKDTGSVIIYNNLNE